LILDPAMGTGNFLHAVVAHIRSGFMQRGDAHEWPAYVREQLLPRLFGFELLAAPYAAARSRLECYLAGYGLPPAQRTVWGVDVAEGERMALYRADTLLGPDRAVGFPFLASETRERGIETVQGDALQRPLVVIGNPPYAGHSSNNGAWIHGLLRG